MRLFFALFAVAAFSFLSAAQAQPYHVYVAAESEDEVALVRFDGGEAVVESVIPVGTQPTEIDGPHGLTVAPDGAHWYLSIAHGKPFGRVVKYETGTNRKVGSAEVGMFPATMQISTQTGLLYVANFNLHGTMKPSSVSVVDPEAMVEVERIETGPMPHGSRLTADGRRHYSVAMMAGMLYEIDAVSLQVRRTLKTGGDASKPTWVQPHPSEPLLYVANNGADEVVEVNTEAWRITRTFATRPGTNPYNLDVTPDGSTLVVTYKGSGETGVWDLAGGTETAVVANSRSVSHGVVVSRDGRYAFVSAEGIGGEPGALDVIDLQEGKRVASADVGKQAGGVALWDPGS